MPLSSLGCSITAPGGNLTLTSAPYRLEKDTRQQQQVTKRKTEATNPFVEGSYTIAAVRENVMEMVNVYVQAATDAATYDAVKKLTDALDQVLYTMTFNRNNVTETWTCFSADYVVGSQHEFQHANLVVVRATIPRLPKITKVTV